jgi:hypothetical protein
MEITLYHIIKYLKPEAIPFVDFEIRNDGTGEKLYKWDEGKLGPIPTLEFLESKRAEVEAAPRKIAEVAMWRIRAVLQVMGLVAQVEQLINLLEEPNRTVALVAWNFGNTIERNSPTVMFLQSGLQLTAVQVDNLFVQADEIVI